MASPPKFTENSDAPLSADELEADRDASAQTTDPLDKPDADGSAVPHGEEIVTLLPPG